MSFQETWDSLLAQTRMLRIALFTAIGLVAVLGATTATLSVREPVVIEKGCQTVSLVGGKDLFSEGEVREFSELVVRQRFETDLVPSPSWFTDKEYKFRVAYQQDVTAKKEGIRLIIRETHVEGELVTIRGDKVSASGSYRNVVRIIATLRIAKISRTAENPFGLLLLGATMEEDRSSND